MGSSMTFGSERSLPCFSHDASLNGQERPVKILLWGTGAKKCAIMSALYVHISSGITVFSESNVATIIVLIFKLFKFELY